MYKNKRTNAIKLSSNDDWARWARSRTRQLAGLADKGKRQSVVGAKKSRGITVLADVISSEANSNQFAINSPRTFRCLWLS